MAKFKSELPELGFYFDGKFKKFKYGEYNTENEKEIELLSNFSGVTRIDESKTSLEKFMEKEDKKKAEAKKKK